MLKGNTVVQSGDRLGLAPNGRHPRGATDPLALSDGHRRRTVIDFQMSDDPTARPTLFLGIIAQFNPRRYDICTFLGACLEDDIRWRHFPQETTVEGSLLVFAAIKRKPLPEIIAPDVLVQQLMAMYGVATTATQLIRVDNVLFIDFLELVLLRAKDLQQASEKLAADIYFIEYRGRD